MTALDIITLLLCGGAGLLGLQRGFVTEALSLAAWVAALAAVKFLHGPVSAAMTGMVGTASGAAVLAFALIFGITFLVVKIAAKSIGNQTKSSAIGGFDRVLGLGFGLVKGLIGATILFAIASLGHDMINGGASRRPDWMTQSRTYPLLNATSGAFITYVSERRKAGGGEQKPTP